eukprot:1695088-Prorocentrum_lima.AAC.1
MSGVDILRINKMGPRLLQAYCATDLFPEGVEADLQWAVSPPCAGLQDLAWKVRTENFHHMLFRVSGYDQE